MPSPADVSWPRPFGTLLFLLAWLTPWRPSFRVRAAQSRLAFYVTHRDTIGRHIAKYGTHEPLLTRWVNEFLGAAPPGIVVDVGANLGWHALHAARQPHVEAVLAFEPDPFNAWLIERNLAANGIDNVIVDARAVGAALGRAKLHRYKSTNIGRHSLAIDHGFGSRDVLMTDLDGALAAAGFGQRAVSLIKIDVEGYEPAVIAGAKETLKRTSALILEYSPDISGAGGLSVAGLLADLQGAGFSPHVLLNTGGTTAVGYEELQRFSGTLDVIFIRSARLSELSRGLNARPRGTLSLDEIADRNKRVKTPV
jgi:FkbM family methyltransferase